jgi:hypothetical protein
MEDLIKRTNGRMMKQVPATISKSDEGFDGMLAMKPEPEQLPPAKQYSPSTKVVRPSTHSSTPTRIDRAGHVHLGGGSRVLAVNGVTVHRC